MKRHDEPSRLRKLLRILGVRNTDPKTSLDSACMAEESGETEKLVHYIPDVLSLDVAKCGLTTRQICRFIKVFHGKYYERDSVSPLMRALERMGKVKATRIVRKDQQTGRFVIVWALPKYANSIKPQGDFERWENE
jgi:hypothetical protein